MRILVIGGGGREHTLTWKLKQDSCNPEIFCAPGNAGTAALGTNLPIKAEDIDGLVQWAEEHLPDLTVVGPEAPLCAGVTDAFQKLGLRVFGPSKAAAQMEGSKRFAKEIMQAAGVPTAKADSFSDAAAAKAYIDELGAPIVVKADGLAAGKGVTVCQTVEEAYRAVDESLVEQAFGEAGSEVLIEEFLAGEEASILGLIDGERTVLLATSQDHKPALDGDRGPNTGGMGAYSPAPIVPDDQLEDIRRTVFDNTVAALKEKGITFKGVLYAGLMITSEGHKVLEFNVRFGDPECQVVLPRWQGDIIPALQACVDGTLSEEMVQWHDGAAACIVLASGGYPGSYEKGKPISGLDEAGSLEDVTVFHAGTKLDEQGQTVTAGGRVLGVTARGDNLKQALKKAYEATSKIDFDGVHYRSDIGQKGLKRLV